MSDTRTPAAALLERLRYKGLHLSATAEGHLQVWPAVWLDEASSESIRAHKSGLLALLSAAAVDVLEDDRHRCRQPPAADCVGLPGDHQSFAAASGEDCPWSLARTHSGPPEALSAAPGDRDSHSGQQDRHHSPARQPRSEGVIGPEQLHVRGPERGGVALR